MNDCDTLHNVTCPFCGLACDELEITRNGGKVTAQNSLPVFCRSSYENSNHGADGAQPQINGEEATLEEAATEAARLIAAAGRPLLAGMLLDVNGAREAVRLARACGGIVDHADADSVLCNLKTVQNTGWIAATLSEARVRADFIVVIGNRVFERSPRLIERILTGKRLLGTDAEPEFALIGPWDGRVPAALESGLFELVDVPAEQIQQCAHTLTALAHDHPPQDDRGRALLRIIDKIKQSSYTCVIWDAGDLKHAHAELTVETLALLLRRLNLETRCTGVPMGGNGTTFNNVCTWQTASPVRTDFSTQPPVYDPVIHATERLLSGKAVDLLLWTAAVRPQAPPDCELPTIAITRPDAVPARPLQVHIPVGIPGIDHAGHVSRCDSVVMLPLKQLRPSSLASAAQALAAINRHYREQTQQNEGHAA